MQELPFHKQRQASVSFTYGTSPLQPSRSLDKSQEPQPKQISKISLRSRKNINIEIKPPQSSNIQEASQVRTLKK